MLDGTRNFWYDIVGALIRAGYKVTEERVQIVKTVSDERQCPYGGGMIYYIIEEMAKKHGWSKG